MTDENGYYITPEWYNGIVCKNCGANYDKLDDSDDFSDILVENGWFCKGCYKEEQDGSN